MKAQTSLLSAALLLGVFATGAQAAFQSCVNGPSDPGPDYDILSKVSSATDCTILLPLYDNKNDNPMPDFVNTKAFFGISNWLYDGKWNDLTDTDGTNVDTLELFTFYGGNQAGRYTYLGATGIDKVMFVFKDGAGTNLVGYLVGRTDGYYYSPFVNPPFAVPGSGAKDISHISVYYTTSSGGGGEVPEPGVLGLLGLGLLGLALARRRA